MSGGWARRATGASGTTTMPGCRDKWHPVACCVFRHRQPSSCEAVCDWCPVQAARRRCCRRATLATATTASFLALWPTCLSRQERGAGRGDGMGMRGRCQGECVSRQWGNVLSTYASTKRAPTAPLAASQLAARSSGPAADGCRYSIRVSFAEIYNEQIYDLIRFDKRQLAVGYCCDRAGDASGARPVLHAAARPPTHPLAPRPPPSLPPTPRLPALCRCAGTPPRASTCPSCSARSAARWRRRCRSAHL